MLEEWLSALGDFVCRLPGVKLGPSCKDWFPLDVFLGRQGWQLQVILHVDPRAYSDHMAHKAPLLAALRAHGPVRQGQCHLAAAAWGQAVPELIHMKATPQASVYWSYPCPTSRLNKSM